MYKPVNICDMGNNLSSLLKNGKFSGTKMIRDLEQIPSEKRLKELELFSLEEGS